MALPETVPVALLAPVMTITVITVVVIIRTLAPTAVHTKPGTRPATYSVQLTTCPATIACR
jgi:hypothetical protein